MSNGKRNLSCLIGWPTSYSLSPRLHNYWLRHYKIDSEYVAIPVKPEELDDFMRYLAGSGMRGINITAPHKERVFDLLQHFGEVDAIANKVEAVNTIIVKNGKLCGTNTDVYGFAENIRPHLPARKKKAVVLGAGGALRAVIAALDLLGFESGFYVNRTPKRVKIISRFYDENKFSSQSQPWEQRDYFLKDADLLVNATSLGMTGNDPLDIDLSLLPTTALVTDIVYSPLMTPLLEAAKARGNPVVDGLGMLLHQAVPAFDKWFGARPRVTDELRKYMLGE